MTINKFEKGNFKDYFRGIQAATKFIEILGVEAVNSLAPSLKSVIDDNKWRVRLELIKSLAELAI